MASKEAYMRILLTNGWGGRVRVGLFKSLLESCIFSSAIFPSFDTTEDSCCNEDNYEKREHDSNDKNNDRGKSVVNRFADSKSEGPKYEICQFTNR